MNHYTTLLTRRTRKFQILAGMIGVLYVFIATRTSYQNYNRSASSLGTLPHSSSRASIEEDKADRGEDDLGCSDPGSRPDPCLYVSQHCHIEEGRFDYLTIFYCSPRPSVFTGLLFVCYVIDIKNK